MGAQEPVGVEDIAIQAAAGRHLEDRTHLLAPPPPAVGHCDGPDPGLVEGKLLLALLAQAVELEDVRQQHANFFAGPVAADDDVARPKVGHCLSPSTSTEL